MATHIMESQFDTISVMHNGYYIGIVWSLAGV